MPLDSEVLLLAGLVEMELPTRTVRVCDGGFVDWPGRGVFPSEDEDFGTIESVEAVAEAVGDEAPGGRVTFLPPSIAVASAIFQPTAQGKPIRFWLAEVNRSTGLMVGTPEMMFDGLIDMITVRVSRSTRAVDVEFVSEAERLFMIREGNVLSPRFHQEGWPGERGFDHATGAQTAVPWGAPDPGRGTVHAAGAIAGVRGGNG